MTITDPMVAVNTIADGANQVHGKMFDDTIVENLAKFFKGGKSIFLIAVKPSVVGGKVTNYLVGVRDATEDRISFVDDIHLLYSAPNKLPRTLDPSFVVPMIPSTEMEKVGTSVVFPHEHVPPAAPIHSTWKLLDLTHPAAVPQLVLTSQLTGCTFAIGRIGHHVYLGHVQPKGTTGTELAKSLSQGPIFNGLPAPLESKFLIEPGDDSKAGSTLGYGDSATKSANVLGMVVNGKLSFLVTVVARSTPKIEKVMLVTQTSPTSGWSSKQI